LGEGGREREERAGEGRGRGREEKGGEGIRREGGLCPNMTCLHDAPVHTHGT